MHVIVGLGNHPKEYDNTRHNAGFYMIDMLAKKHNIDISKKKFKSLVGQGKINGQDVLLVKPQMYMNLSGQCVSQITNFYKLPMKDLCIIYDDIDIPFGSIRYREGGSGGTHNGMRSIIECLGKQDFPRIRIGIMGVRHETQDLASYVLEKFTKDEQEKLVSISDLIIEKIEEHISKEKSNI